MRTYPNIHESVHLLKKGTTFARTRACVGERESKCICCVLEGVGGEGGGGARLGDILFDSDLWV